jgi:hypothetical protein
MNESEQAIENIKDTVRQIMQLIVQRGQPLSQGLKDKLAQVMDHAANRISQLRQKQKQDEELEEAETEQAEIADTIGAGQEEKRPQILGGIGDKIPELEQAPHESSNINAFRYDPQSGKLFVKFQGKYPKQNGPVYSYDGIPKNIYDVFRRGAVAPKTSGKNAWHTWKEGVTPSHGAAMYALIKQGGYPYQRLS